MLTRRAWLRAFLQLGSIAAGSAALLSTLHWTRGAQPAPAGARGRLGLLRPPGSADEQLFLARCIRCNRCRDACEAGCIRLFDAAAGDHACTPYIVPEDRACTLCMECGRSCPTSAIVAEDRIEAVAMGLAVVDERLCVSHNGTGVCGACFTVCPLRGRAITQNLRNAPVVHEGACVGCGLCEEVCIVRERRAIQVQTRRSWYGETAARGSAA